MSHYIGWSDASNNGKKAIVSFVITDESRQPVYSFSGELDFDYKDTVFSEYIAFYLMTKYVIRHQIQNISLYSDCFSLISTLCKQKQPKAPKMKIINNHFQAFLRDCQQPGLTKCMFWLPREHNIADAKCRESMERERLTFSRLFPAKKEEDMKPLFQRRHKRKVRKLREVSQNHDKIHSYLQSLEKGVEYFPAIDLFVPGDLFSLYLNTSIDKKNFSVGHLKKNFMKKILMADCVQQPDHILYVYGTLKVKAKEKTVIAVELSHQHAAQTF